MKALLNIKAGATGTGKYSWETTFKVPDWASWITGIIPYVSQDMPTRDEEVVIIYEIYRGIMRLIKFKSEPILPPLKWVNFGYKWDAPTLAPIKKIYLAIPVTPGETLRLIRTNTDYYVCSPMAGLEIEYATKPD